MTLFEHLAAVSPLAVQNVKRLAWASFFMTRGRARIPLRIGFDGRSSCDIVGGHLA